MNIDLPFFDQTNFHWITETYYPEYERFLNLYNKDVSCQHHLERGGSTMFYKWDYGYPTEVDPAKDYLTFLRNSVSTTLQDATYASSWWIDYPPGSYSVAHQHIQSRRFSAILFLSDYELIRKWPHAGNLYSMSNAIGYKEWEPKAGNVIIMDGGIHHGSYPAINERKVFVIDFEYN